MSFFKDIPDIRYEGPDTANDFAYRHYNPDEVVAGKTMADHLRFAVAYWHSFAWEGGDPFGGRTFDRPWFGDTMDDARQALDSVIGKLERQFLKFKDKHSAKARRHRSND